MSSLLLALLICCFGGVKFSSSVYWCFLLVMSESLRLFRALLSVSNGLGESWDVWALLRSNDLICAGGRC